MRIGRRAFIATGIVTLAGVPAARAKIDWPTRPVKFIVPLAAGGALDFIARQCSAALSRVLNQQVFVENHTGAGGTIGMDAAMKSAPDGYTFLVANDNAAIAPHILNLAYDYTEVLLPVITITRQPVAVAVHPSLGVNSVAEFIAYAKAKPGLGFATSGVGSNQHVVGEWLAKEANIKLDHVPYRGAGQAVSDLIAGHVRAAILGPAALLPQARAGSITLIAQSGARRAAALPEVPTLVESGFAGMVLESWGALFAPPQTPQDIIAALNVATATAIADPVVRENYTKASMEIAGGSPEALGTLARADSEKYARLVKELGITAG